MKKSLFSAVPAVEILLAGKCPKPSIKAEKIGPIKSTLKKALEYIQNPDKIDDKMLVSSLWMQL